MHKSSVNGEICGAVGRRRGKKPSPTAVAAGIPGWQTQGLGCLKCLFPIDPDLDPTAGIDLKKLQQLWRLIRTTPRRGNGQKKENPTTTRQAESNSSRPPRLPSERT